MSNTTNKSNLDILFTDYPITKQLTRGGELKTYQNSDALSQAIKIWLVSQKGEKIRTLSGGVLLPFLGKEMTIEKASLIRKNILKGLTEDFSPSITVVSLEVKPNYNKNLWEITIVGYNADLAIGVNSAILISNI